MSFSGLPSPAEALIHMAGDAQAFAQAGNRPPAPIESGPGFFRDMRYSLMLIPAALLTGPHFSVSLLT